MQPFYTLHYIVTVYCVWAKPPKFKNKINTHSFIHSKYWMMKKSNQRLDDEEYLPNNWMMKEKIFPRLHDEKNLPEGWMMKKSL